MKLLTPRVRITLFRTDASRNPAAKLHGIRDADTSRVVNISSQRRSVEGLSLVELFVVLAVLVILALIILPGLARSRARAKGITCVNNVKQVGLSFRIFANDNEDQFPMQISTNKGGSLEFVSGPYAFRHFQVLSNELSTPRVLLCPKDHQRRIATNFMTDLANHKISYFVGLDATPHMTNMFLTGDRNIQSHAQLQNGILSLTTNHSVAWTREIHETNGNLLFAEGRVEQPNSSGLMQALSRTGAHLNF